MELVNAGLLIPSNLSNEDDFTQENSITKKQKGNSLCLCLWHSTSREVPSNLWTSLGRCYLSLGGRGVFSINTHAKLYKWSQVQCGERRKCIPSNDRGPFHSRFHLQTPWQYFFNAANPLKQSRHRGVSQLCPITSKTFHFVYLFLTLRPQDVKLPAHSKLSAVRLFHFQPNIKTWSSALGRHLASPTTITKVALLTNLWALWH